MASEVDICNRALQRLGATRITSLTDDSKNARNCNLLYELIRDAELREHPWSFAVGRVVLAPSATAPAFGYKYAFPLPSDYLRILPDNEVTDWQIESGNILTDGGTTLKLIYIKRITDTNEYDALFVEALSARLAMELCEVITQSNTKKEAAAAMYNDALAKAKKINAFERVSQEAPTDDWDLARF